MGLADETRPAVRTELIDHVDSDAFPGKEPGRAPSRRVAAGTPIIVPAATLGPVESNRTTSARGDSSEGVDVTSPSAIPSDVGQWTELQDVRRNRLGHQILLAMDDHVIVEASSGDRLVKIPIAR